MYDEFLKWMCHKMVFIKSTKSLIMQSSKNPILFQCSIIRILKQMTSDIFSHICGITFSSENVFIINITDYLNYKLFISRKARGWRLPYTKPLQSIHCFWYTLSKLQLLQNYSPPPRKPFTDLVISCCSKFSILFLKNKSALVITP